VFQKFALRRRWLLAASTLAVLTIFGLAVMAWWQARLAQKRFNDVQGLAGSVLHEIYDSIAPLPGSTPARKLLAQRSLEYLDRLSTDASQDERLTLTLVEGYRRLGRILGGVGESNLGDREGGLAAVQKAQRLIETLRARTGDSEPVMESAAVVQTLLARMLPRETAPPAARRAIAICEALVARNGNTKHRSDLAAAYLTYTDVSVANQEENIAYRRKAVRIYEALLHEEPGDLNHQRNTALARKRLGSSLCTAGKQVECLTEMEEAQRLDELRYKGDPLNQDARMDLAITLSELAMHLRRFGRPEKVFEFSERSVQLRREAWEQDRSNARYAGRLVYALTTLAFYYEEAGRLGNASQLANEAVEVTGKLKGRLDFPREVLTAYRTMGRLEKKLRRSGCPYFLRAVQVYEEMTPEVREGKTVAEIGAVAIAEARQCRDTVQ
jgi:tetratricopeptide (TPR) repeat protein